WRATLTEPSLPTLLIASDAGQRAHERMGYGTGRRFELWSRKSPEEKAAREPAAPFPHALDEGPGRGAGFLRARPWLGAAGGRSGGDHLLPTGAGAHARALRRGEVRARPGTAGNDRSGRGRDAVAQRGEPRSGRRGGHADAERGRRGRQAAAGRRVRRDLPRDGARPEWDRLGSGAQSGVAGRVGRDSGARVSTRPLYTPGPYGRAYSGVYSQEIVISSSP